MKRVRVKIVQIQRNILQFNTLFFVSRAQGTRFQLVTQGTPSSTNKDLRVTVALEYVLWVRAA